MTRIIDDARIASAPASVYYIPDFITVEEEQLLIDKVLTAPKPKWVYLKNRRLQNWGGIVKDKGMIAEPLPTWLTELFPRFKDSQVFEGLDQTHFVPNHCLVNEYLAGQGIMPHKDGPAYLPTVATISLSSHCVLEFFKSAEVEEEKEKDKDDSNLHKEDGSVADKRHAKEPVFSLLVQPRSLLVLKEDVYNKYMHGIREVTEDDLRERNILNLAAALPGGFNDENPILKRETRISLTFRIVQKTISSSKFFLRK